MSNRDVITSQYMKRQHGDICPGEYYQVASQSRDLASLREAHATPCSSQGARNLLAALRQTFVVMPFTISLGQAKWGQAGKRYRYTTVEAWRYTRTDGREVVKKRRQYLRDETGHYVGEYFVSLPSKPTQHPGVGLRVGLVLHEFAHLLHYHRTQLAQSRGDDIETRRFYGTGWNHGPAFVQALDDVVAWWIALRPRQDEEV